MGRYAESIAALDRASAIVPDNAETRATRELYYLCWKADTRPLHRTIDAILAQGPSAIASAADIWFDCALAERPAAAERALVALGDNPCWFESAISLSHSFGEGLLARMTKDEPRARTAFEAARAQQEKVVQAQPNYGPALCVLGLRRLLGAKTWPWTKADGDQHTDGKRCQQRQRRPSIFRHHSSVDGQSFALQQLETGLRAPVASLMLSYGALKLFPVWDPLRTRSRLKKSVASLIERQLNREIYGLSKHF